MKLYFLLCLLLLTSCATTDRRDLANDLARDHHFIQRQIAAEPFILTSYEHIADRDSEAHIYIEGDGFAWKTRSRPSDDPTPYNPVALKLAVKDSAPNVIYIARPCQYTQQTCAQKYWTSHRSAPEVVAAMNAALDDIKARYGITRFHLIGFSGGANIAALLTAGRDDVFSLRTVAGTLDHELLYHMHNVSQTPQSLNAINVAKDINHIPQHHFIGDHDNIVYPQIAQSYIRASGDTRCLHVTMVPDTNHNKGWPKKWPQLLTETLACRGN